MAVVTAMLECLTLALAIQPSVESILPLFKSCTWTLLWFISAWVPCHLIGTVLVSLPALSIFSHITCDMQLSTQLVQRVATSPFFQLISLLVIQISPVQCVTHPFRSPVRLLYYLKQTRLHWIRLT